MVGMVELHRLALWLGSNPQFLLSQHSIYDIQHNLCWFLPRLEDTPTFDRPTTHRAGLTPILLVHVYYMYMYSCPCSQTKMTHISRPNRFAVVSAVATSTTIGIAASFLALLDVAHAFSALSIIPAHSSVQSKRCMKVRDTGLHFMNNNFN